MKHKTCSVCNRIKRVDEFAKRTRSKDGLQPRCKECDKNKSRQYYENNSEKVNKRTNQWMKNNYEWLKRWRKNNPGVKAARKKQEQMHPNRIKARKAVNVAVKHGKMPPIKSLSCKVCGKQAQEYHHHKGYDKEYWLDVVPLCKKCHKN